MDFAPSAVQKRLIASSALAAQKFTRQTQAKAFCGSSDWFDCADDGWAGLCLSSTSGGGSYNALDSVVAFEALGKNGADRGALFAVGAHLFGCAKAVERFGSDPARAMWLPRLASGQAVGALALTEDGGGSQLACDNTTLVSDGGNGFILNGAKTYITNGTVADVYVVLAKQPEALSPMNLTAVLLPANAATVHAQSITGGLGLIGTDMARLSFIDCRVTADQVLGKNCAGLGVALSTMQWERSCILAGALGALERDFLGVCQALRHRRDAAGSLVNHQGVSHKLADLRQRIEVARLMMYRAAWELDQNGDQILYPALSKLTLAETLLDGAIELQRLMGAAGWANAMELGQAVQDAMAMSAASGTSEIQRNLIANRMGNL